MTKLARQVLLILLCVAVLVPSARTDATTMVYADLEWLTEVSDVVVYGTIVDIHTAEGETFAIETTVTVKVFETWKGAPLDQLTFNQAGGELNGYELRVPGDARFAVGEEYVLFLHGQAPDDLYLSALGQSAFHVMPTGDPNAPITIPNSPLNPVDHSSVTAVMDIDPFVIRDLSGIAFYDGTLHDPIYRLTSPEIMTLSELKRAVEEAEANRPQQVREE